MRVEVLDDAEAAAFRAAEVIAEEAAAAVKQRGRFSLAVSGGRTPWLMLRELASLVMPWRDVHILQVDERIAPAGDPDRNWTHLVASLELPAGDVPELHAMPVDAVDLDAAVRLYAQTLAAIAGEAPVLDLIHLGLGSDGHTASLVPGDASLDVMDADVSLAGPYQGRRRMTLTYPLLNRARRVLWLVTGAEKADMLARLRRHDPSIPAGRVRQDEALVIADRAAAQEG